MADEKELFHSEIYLGKEFSNGICHYKYLKKVKSPSGKWRYIYDETELKNEEKKIAAINKTYDKHRDKDGNYRYRKADGGEFTRFKSGGSGTSYILGVKKSTKQSKKDKFKENLDLKRERTIKKHSRQKLKDFPKRTISRGIGAVNKFILNIEKNWIR